MFGRLSSHRKLALSFILMLSLPLTAMAAKSTSTPNIVLVVMDNFGYGEIGVYGGGVLRGAPTPNIDSIAAEGFQLTNFNVEAECTPSRAALMTGRYGIRTRQQPKGPPRGIWYGLTQWEITLAEMLSDTGYATGMFGKWHLGELQGAIQQIKDLMNGMVFPIPQTKRFGLTATVFRVMRGWNLPAS
jgi:arylsulfatase A-like enzyme